MSRMTSASVYLGGMITCMTTSQVLLKFAGIQAAVGFDVVHAFFYNFWLWSGLLVSGVGLICWLKVLRNMPLSVAYPWTALIYVLTPLASVMLFDDVLDAKYMLGMASIVAGIFFTTGGVETS